MTITPERGIEATLQLLMSDDVAGLPVTISIPNGTSQMFSGFVFDSRLQVSEVRLEGVPGTILRSYAPSRRRLAISASDSPIFKILPGTTTRVVLSNLQIEGSVRVEGGTLEMRNCTLHGLHSESAVASQGAVGLEASGGKTIFIEGEIISFEGGGVSVLAGTVELENSVIRYNGRSSTARIGGVKVDGGLVTLSTTLIEDNGYISETCAGGLSCVNGGGLKVDSAGRAVLRAGTLLRGNKAFSGSSIYVSSSVTQPTPVRYELPAPLAHYILIMDIDKGLSYSDLPSGLVDETYPFECGAGKYGIDALRDVQASPRCSGVCPAGYYCPVATIEPNICSNGTYCPRGSSVETSCPPGTFGVRQGLSDITQCRICREGTQCLAGSAIESPCSPGSYATANGSSSCSLCLPGTYQDNFEQTSCKQCLSGHFCGAGSASPVACPAGYFSAQLGLNSSSQCKPWCALKHEREHKLQTACSDGPDWLALTPSVQKGSTVGRGRVFQARVPRGQKG